MSAPNTLFLRLAGPMQSWGTSSRLQIRRTARYPSKSGVLGLILCAKGVRREDSESELKNLNRLLMGVRVDLPGALDWDYHTVGAPIGRDGKWFGGNRQAEGGVKLTASTKMPEVQLSRRQYLLDASFLVALQGDPGLVADCAKWLDEPIWPIYLGRKCCIPSDPVLAATGEYSDLKEALASQPWMPRLWDRDKVHRPKDGKLDVYLELAPGAPIPDDVTIVYDAPKWFGYWSHEPRIVINEQVTVDIGGENIRRKHHEWRNPYSEHFRNVAAPARRKFDHHLCVFCKSPAVQVHHVTYENCGDETNEDLRTLCDLCHDACTSLEYGHDMRQGRFDPADQNNRDQMLRQIENILKERRFSRRRSELLEAGRQFNRHRSEED